MGDSWLLSSRVSLTMVTSTISTNCLDTPVDTVFIFFCVLQGIAPDEGGKFQHHHVWSAWITGNMCGTLVFLCVCKKVLGGLNI